MNTDDPNPWRSLCQDLLTTLDHVAGALPCIGVDRHAILKAVERDSAGARQRLAELDQPQ